MVNADLYMHKDVLLHLVTGEAHTAMRKGVYGKAAQAKIAKKGIQPQKSKVIVMNCAVNGMSRALRYGKLHIDFHRRPSGQMALRYTNIVDGFFAILDSPNGASTLRMLMDQKEHIGYRTVERIVVFGYTKPKEMAKKVSTATCEGNWRADDIGRCSRNHKLETIQLDESSIHVAFMQMRSFKHFNSQISSTGNFVIPPFKHAEHETTAATLQKLIGFP